MKRKHFFQYTILLTAEYFNFYCILWITSTMINELNNFATLKTNEKYVSLTHSIIIIMLKDLIMMQLELFLISKTVNALNSFAQ